MLHIHNASKQFGNTLVLDKFNLSIQDNSLVGLAGPSGSGKSTLLRCIQELEKLDSGSIHFDGHSGFMFQDFQLFPHLNILDNLSYAPRLKNKQENHQEKATKLLKTLGIVDKLYSFPHQLSGGQKQRVALARSLMMQPDLLLCDEPTSGLDMATTHEVISLLLEVKKMKVTMLIASHDLEFLTHISERLIIIRQGSIVADFIPSQISDPISYTKRFYLGEAQ